MDIAVTVITVAVVLFFVAVILSNVPWGRILGSRKQEEKVELAPGLRIRDPGPRCFFDPGIRDGKISGSGMNIPDNFS
jgi:hypothetical protein